MKRERDIQMLLWALINGVARWEWLPSLTRGEICVGGLRYVADLDSSGIPVINEIIRSAIQAASGPLLDY